MNKTEWNRQKLLETSGYYWKTCALHSGVKLNIFTIIDEAPLTAEKIANRIRGDKRSVPMLLDSLAAMGLLKKENGLYSNLPESSAYLSKTSPEYIGFMILHHHHMMNSWAKLDQAVINGKPTRERASYSDGEKRESFLMGMFNSAIAVAPEIAKIISLSGCNRLLDLGGGPGTYAIYFCLENPELKAVVYDLPETRPYAEKTIKRFNLSEKVEFVEGNYLSGDFKLINEFDAVWLSHIIHAEGEENIKKIIAKALSSLKPGGKIFIHEFILNKKKDGPLYPALFSLNMLLGTKSGRSYSEEEIFDFLKINAVKNIRRLDFKGPKDSGIIEGTI